ncbi:MAG: BACON domain-containing protein [Bacteroidales bacterium]|nr:BACON domain-containing protein [Bacteroidales bacterium]
MKRFPFLLPAIAALTLAAGCQREEVVAPAEGPAVDVTFNVGLQDLRTKAAFSDGTKAKDLTVLVYANRTDGSLYLESLSQDLAGAFANGLTARVTLKLIRGENYSIVFWAQAPNAPYTLDKTNGTVTAATDGLANDELRDAFYALWSQQVGSTGAHDYSVELHRPLAQVNVLTTAEDWAVLETSQVQFAGSSLTVEAPTVLNLVTGEAGTPKNYTLTRNAITEAVNIPGYAADKYKYVSMNYVLAGDRATSNLYFGVYRGTDDLLFDYAVPNVPFQRNWRTVIVGSIFGVDGTFSVSIVPDYLGTEELPVTGNGGSTTYTVSIASQIDNGTVAVAGTATSFEEGEHVTLTVTPDNNYELSTLFYNEEGVDNAVPIEKDASGAYAFNMPANNVTVYASFTEKQAAAVPVITASDISGIPAAGVTNATTAVTVTNIDASWTVRANCDGVIVTDASWSNDVLTYTVAQNTGAARSGKVIIYVVKGDEEYSKQITISQLAGGTPAGEFVATMDQSALAAAPANNAKVDLDDVISFTNSSNYGTTPVSELRIYKGKDFVVSAISGYSIKKIRITCTASGTAKYGPGCFGAGAPDGYSYESSGRNGVWDGSVGSVIFTAKGDQVRIASLEVVYIKNQ